MTTREEKRRLNRAPLVLCPACGDRCSIVKSDEQSHTLRQIYYKCEDPLECGLSFVAHLVFVRELSPSAHGKVNPHRRLVRRKAIEVKMTTSASLATSAGQPPPALDGPPMPPPVGP